MNKKWGFIKKWSRETFLKIAADEIKVNIPPETIHNAATIYWDAITDKTDPFKEAKEIINYITNLGHPVYLLTSSDGRLMIKNGFFRYDSKISGSFKRNRMKTLAAKGLKFRDIIVGDPEDKPLPGFYERTLKTIEKDIGKKINFSSVVMVGNSFEDDLETPVNIMGIGTGVLLVKEKNSKKENNNIYKVGNLLDIIQLLNI